MMSQLGQVPSAWNERMRLIRLRRKKERLEFWNEFKLIPAWVRIGVAVLYVAAVAIVVSVNLSYRHNPYGNEMFPWELREHPVLASLAMTGIVTLISAMLAWIIFMITYVNRDAARRGMNSALWTLFVLILMPSSGGIIGFVIYLLMREPLPYPCPRCDKPVGPRFNFCPNCKCNLHPSCPNCKKEIVETDKFCPYCATELGPVELPEAAST
jgi:Double zinc ribbon